MTAGVCSIEGWSKTPAVVEFEAMARKQFNLQHELRLANGKAEALLAVLAARGVVVNETVRGKLLACKDLGLLDRLLVQAATAASPADVLKAAA